MAHVIIAVAVQVAVATATGNWWAGGLVMGAFYYGREITQAEYRWIKEFGQGRRVNLPWWGFLDPRIWNPKSIADALLPALVCFGVWVGSGGLEAIAK